MPDHNDEDPTQPHREQPAPDPGEPEDLPDSVRHHARVRALRIGAASAVVTAVVAVIAAAGGGSLAKPGTTAAAGISPLLAGIPQSGNTLGSPTAPVTLQYFGDLECSTAREFTLETLPLIITNWVRSGKLRIEYRSLRSVSEPKVFDAQQIAALAAGMQNKLWYYLEDFYHEQGPEHSGYVTESYLRDLARQVPRLNLTLWSRDRNDPQLTTQVTQDEQAAYAAHLHDTPSFLIGRTGSSPTRTLDQSSALDPAAFNDTVRQLLYSQTDHGRQVSPKAASVASARSGQHVANIASRDGLPTSAALPPDRHLIRPLATQQ